MTLNGASLSVGGSTVLSSDQRLKINAKPLSNALDDINRLEPVEYDQTQDLTEIVTEDTPQSHQ